MNSRSVILLFAFSVLMASCNQREAITSDIFSSEFRLAGGQTASLKKLAGSDGIVLVFYSPECPLCINYTRTVRSLEESFGSRGYSFVTVFPGVFYTEDTIRSFLTNYNLSMPAILDTESILARSCGATVTPEAVLCDRNGLILYRGAIDDWAYAEGKKRLAPVKLYLKNALEAADQGRTPSPSVTEPVGCFIE